MRYLIVAFTAVFAAIGAVVLAGMGMDYMNPAIGHGLHPAIAFSVATLLLCLAVVQALLMSSIEDDPFDEAEHDQAVLALTKDGIYLNGYDK